jgi:hypothetical protein
MHCTPPAQMLPMEGKAVSSLILAVVIATVLCGGPSELLCPISDAPRVE